MEKDVRKLEAVIFDMDGTLIDTETLGHASWDHAGDDVGMYVPLEVKNQMVGRNLRDIQRIVEGAFPGQDVGELLDRANFHYHRLVTETIPPVKPGAEELLEWLASLNVPLALATSSMSYQAEDKLGRTGLRSYFEFLIAGDQVQHGKPHPEIFLKAAAGLHCPPDACAVFEDSGPGIEGARTAGSLAILVPEHEPVPLDWQKHAHEVLPDLHHARRRLEYHGIGKK